MKNTLKQACLIALSVVISSIAFAAGTEVRLSMPHKVESMSLEIRDSKKQLAEVSWTVGQGMHMQNFDSSMAGATAEIDTDGKLLIRLPQLAAGNYEFISKTFNKWVNSGAYNYLHIDAQAEKSVVTIENYGTGEQPTLNVKVSK